MRQTEQRLRALEQARPQPILISVLWTEAEVAAVRAEAERTGEPVTWIEWKHETDREPAEGA